MDELLTELSHCSAHVTDIPSDVGSSDVRLWLLPELQIGLQARWSTWSHRPSCCALIMRSRWRSSCVLARCACNLQVCNSAHHSLPCNAAQCKTFVCWHPPCPTANGVLRRANWLEWPAALLQRLARGQQADGLAESSDRFRTPATWTIRMDPSSLSLAGQRATCLSAWLGQLAPGCCQLSAVQLDRQCAPLLAPLVEIQVSGG